VSGISCLKSTAEPYKGPRLPPRRLCCPSSAFSCRLDLAASQGMAAAVVLAPRCSRAVHNLVPSFASPRRSCGALSLLSTGLYEAPVTAELEQGSVVRQITWPTNPESSSPSLSARGEFPLFPSLFPCFWFVKSCTKPRKR